MRMHADIQHASDDKLMVHLKRGNTDVNADSTDCAGMPGAARDVADPNTCAGNTEQNGYGCVVRSVSGYRTAG